MHIVCPHCSTSYAIDLATLGTAGRTVRCSRCKEVWLARQEDARLEAQYPAMAAAGHDAADQDAAEWEALAREEDDRGQPTPHVDSPSIADDWSGEDRDFAARSKTDWPSMAGNDLHGTGAGRRQRLSWLRRLFGPKARPLGSDKPSPGLPTVCAAMGALVLALVIWRVDVVRLMPQTAGFYKLVGLDVNVRGLRFKDVKITSEMVEGKPVLVIEGVITGEASKPVELPRLRFSVRDAQGAEIYAWNTVLEQPVLRPGEKAVFKSRLASPPPEARNIDVRFFSKRDMAAHI
jgi:predicted Zn finger-like uncharacterized protein